MENQKDSGFLGFVLLETKEWNPQLIIKELESTWKIKGNEDCFEEELILMEVNDFRLAISYIPACVPNQEAEAYAAVNYLWEEALSVTKRHQAQILVAVLGNGDELEKGTLLTKAIASCLKQPNALAVYTDGMVYEPEFYHEVAEQLNEHELPILDWVWFGIYHDDIQAGMYTYGMHKFNKEEMEVYVPKECVNFNEIRNFLYNMVAYVLENNVELHDGETIGFSSDECLPITYSEAIALDGYTLKIGFKEGN